ncbi:hypothetical protein E0H73_40075 [Kribbella pittospori]|uniref:Uncharacterized protein n=1 Tax=Kribbella pittospori TaxID=722689 RepID=A0A4R0JZJ1_9ACTN|nr:hypothetical protein [Kribbella pittospori]TCC52137.1 hypothetical protein E0H73_40075 [Kribbella pittospori]
MYYLKIEQDTDQCTATELKAALVAARVPKAKTLNVADVLGKSGHFVSTSEKTLTKVNLWHLTESGIAHVRIVLGVEDVTEIEVKNDISVIHSVVAGVTDEVVRSYLEESVLAYGVGALRAAVVFLWSGAIRQLQDKALGMGVPALNAALLKHDPKARHVGKIEDYSGVKDVVQLLAFREIGLIDKGEWGTLQEGLDLRNRCGHPTKYRPGVKRASAFIEDVVGIAF